MKICDVSYHKKTHRYPFLNIRLLCDLLFLKSLGVIYAAR